MKTDKNILHLTVGEPISASLTRTVATMKAARRGKPVPPYFGVGFDDVGELFSVFTQALGTDRRTARRRRDDCRGTRSSTQARLQNVYNDCERLIEWIAIEKDEDGFVFAPYDEIMVDMKLPDRRAA